MGLVGGTGADYDSHGAAVHRSTGQILVSFCRMLIGVRFRHSAQRATMPALPLAGARFAQSDGSALADLRVIPALPTDSPMNVLSCHIAPYWRYTPL